jgi:hypothetical protein
MSRTKAVQSGYHSRTQPTIFDYNWRDEIDPGMLFTSIEALACTALCYCLTNVAAASIRAVADQVGYEVNSPKLAW